MTVGRSEVVGVRRRLWLLCHREPVGRGLEILVHQRALSAGLMAATLIDLLLAGVIKINHDRVWPDDKPALPRRHLSVRAGLASGGGLVERRVDPIADAVRQVAVADRLPVYELLHLAVLDSAGPHPCTNLYQRTLHELLDVGVVERQSRRLRRPRFAFHNPGEVRWSLDEVHRRLYTQAAATPEVDSLCALGWSLDLARALVTAHEPGDAHRLMREVADTLPARAGALSPMAVVPRLADHVRKIVGERATAAF